MTKTKRMLSRKTKQGFFILSILILPLISFCIFYLYMNFNSFLLAFQKIDLYDNVTYAGFENITTLFEGFKNDSQIFLSLKNSLKIWWISFLITLPLYLAFSYYIFKKNLGHSTLSLMVLVPQVVSTFVYALVYKKFVEIALVDIMELLGYPNFPQLIYDESTAFGNNLFFTIWLSFGMNVLIYTNAMNSIDGRVLESGKIDGVSDVQEFFRIVLPLMWPTLTTILVTSAAGMFVASGNLLTFYMFDAPPSIWGLDYYFTRTIKTSNTMMDYPMVATAGLFVSAVTIPVVFLVKYLMNKFDRTV